MFKVMYFGAPWCGQCKILKPNFLEECKRLGVEYELIDVEEKEEVAYKFQVRNLPTLVFILDGHILGRATGATSWKEIEAYRNRAAMESANEEFNYGHEKQ